MGFFKNSGIYSVRSFYRIVSDGVLEFLTLNPFRRFKFQAMYMSSSGCQNRLLTRDNLAKRRHIHDLSCLFCYDM
jgi:hypothetical protein